VGDLWASVLHCYAWLSKTCNGRPANLLKIHTIISLLRPLTPLVEVRILVPQPVDLNHLSSFYNHGKELERLDRSVVPGDVKRAIDYIHADLDMPLTIGRIATAAGVPGKLSSSASVTRMASRRCVTCGTCALKKQGKSRGARHRNRFASGFQYTSAAFAVEYRLRFGVSPSETLVNVI
jgi:hypothetical protein